MGAKFYFYPMPVANHLVTIDLGEDLAEYYCEFEYTKETAQSMNGKIHQTTTLNREVITIVRDRMSGGEDLAHKLHALQNHLDRGFSVAFAADSAKAFCHPLSKNPVGGDNTVIAHGNPFRSMVGSISPSANDYFVIENQPPAMIQEVQKVSSLHASYTPATGGIINTVNLVNFTFPSICFMRHYRFHPVLKRHPADIGKSIVTNEHGLLWSLELRLTPDYENYFGFHPNQENDVPSGLLQDGLVVGEAEIFERPSVNLDNPPQLNEINANLDLNNNLPWNNWRNFGQ
tara:strand:- start:398 stop:1261 length:864 start_codon:yes stop_codon:yes gene_type:complete